MRLLPAVLLTLVMSWSAFGQTYTISTFAGGGLPAPLEAKQQKSLNIVVPLTGSWLLSPH